MIKAENFNHMTTFGQEEVEMTVGGLQTKCPHFSGKRIEGAEHICRFYDEKNTNGGREHQHEAIS
jgi:hypothetical protein